MSDSRLRDLERRWRQTGAVEDEAAYLTERVRTGDLSETMKQVLLLCEYPAASLAFRARLTPFLAPDTWISLLAGTSLETDVRAAIACARLILPIPATALPRRSLEASITQVVTPTEQNRTFAERAWSTCHEEYLSHFFGEEHQTIVEGSIAVILLTAEIILHRDMPQPLTSIFHRARGLRGVDNVVTAIKSDLIAWALGNDPLPALLARLQFEAVE